MAEEKLNPSNPEARQQLCRSIVEYRAQHSKTRDEVKEQLVAQGMQPSWAALLAYNAEDEAA